MRAYANARQAADAAQAQSRMGKQTNNAGVAEPGKRAGLRTLWLSAYAGSNPAPCNILLI